MGEVGECARNPGIQQILSRAHSHGGGALTMDYPVLDSRRLLAAFASGRCKTPLPSNCRTTGNSPPSPHGCVHCVHFAMWRGRKRLSPPPSTSFSMGEVGECARNPGIQQTFSHAHSHGGGALKTKFFCNHGVIVGDGRELPAGAAMGVKAECNQIFTARV